MTLLYNAVKHGVTAVAIDDEKAKMAVTGPDGKRLTLHKGPVHVYVHKKASPFAGNDAGAMVFQHG